MFDVETSNDGGAATYNNAKSHFVINHKCIAFGMTLMICYYAGVSMPMPDSSNKPDLQPVRDGAIPLFLMVFGYVSMAHYDDAYECERGGRFISGAGPTSMLKPGGRIGKVSIPSNKNLVVYFFHVLIAAVMIYLTMAADSPAFGLNMMVLSWMGMVAVALHGTMLLVSRENFRMRVIRGMHIVIGLVLIAAGGIPNVPQSLVHTSRLLVPSFSVMALVYHGYMFINFIRSGSVLVDA